MPSCAALWIRLSVGVCLLVVLVAAPVCAAADDPPTPESHDADDASSAPAHPDTAAAEADHARPAGLRALYVSFAGLQGLEIDSTMRARAHGGREINPIVGSALGSMPMLVGMKAGATIGIIVLSERLRARHPAAAMLMLAAFNVAYSVIVVHNYSLAHP
jgi:hypothetical protein